MRVAILCNGRDLALWQRRAVDQIAAAHEIFVLACSEPAAPRRRLNHVAYYALNLASIRNRMTKRVPFPAASDVIAERIDAQPAMEGGWAVLPPAAIAWLVQNRIEAVIKFGLNLLRVPPADELPIPILSYHHGDPRSYRGRPAGFYELCNGEPFVGQVVQILGNRLDAGEVVAFAESRAVPHSYRRTLMAAYDLSPHLLPAALAAVEGNVRSDIIPKGRNYRLPGTFQVLGFVSQRLKALLKLLLYGALTEKKWQVATCAVPGAPDPLSAVGEASKGRWNVLGVDRRFAFYADPFFHEEEGAILAEALNRWNGKGEIVKLADGAVSRLSPAGGHLSYPITVAEQGRTYVIPESSEWSAAGIYEIADGRLGRLADLDITAKGLIDPTPFRHSEQVYLFANRVEDGPSVLHLWHAPSIFGRFEMHPCSPIRVSGRGSRMAGHVQAWPDGLYRLGQDNRQGYGDGMLAFRITRLSPTDYAEEETGSAAFPSVRGPHTLNCRAGTLLFDFYTERLSPLAGVRRIIGKL